MNAARTVRVVLDAHSRPAHTIHQNEVSEAAVQVVSFLPKLVYLIALPRAKRRKKVWMKEGLRWGQECLLKSTGAFM